MKKITYKSNINCSSCVAKVTPVLNEIKEINFWEIDTNSPEKLLTIEAQDEITDLVKSALRKVGFKIDKQ